LNDPFDGFDLRGAIEERGIASGLALSVSAVRALAAHARDVIAATEGPLHLSSITDPVEFVDRHIGEAFQGAALLDDGVAGTLVDLGSGNGYPGLPFVASRPGLQPLLVEASQRRAEFLRGIVERDFRSGRVVHAHVQRAVDLDDVEVRVIVTRAMGGWQKVLPRLTSLLGDDGQILVWAGVAMEQVCKRTAWNKLELAERKSVAGRQQSWIWRFVRR